MTRIGFAYNQKPEQSAALTEDESETPRSEEDPPSTGRDDASRILQAPTANAGVASSSDDDLYAEWDSARTIDAIAGAIAAYGEVIRLEAAPDFPERLRAEKPDLVFNIAEGLHGVNR